MEVGVAWAACGLADTGTCVVESTNEDIRLATMLPETSVLLIRRSTILPGNENGAEVLQKFFGKAEPEFLAFISGPSRTADIERVLTLGVHGPLYLHAVLIKRLVFVREAASQSIYHKDCHMKEPARDIKNYRTDLSAALEDTFQRRALDKFAVDYRASRERIYSGLNDRELIAEVAARKDESVRHLDELFVQFKEEAEKRGVQVASCQRCRRRQPHHRQDRGRQRL